jgi:hypothetical protein
VHTPMAVCGRVLRLDVAWQHPFARRGDSRHGGRLFGVGGTGQWVSQA